MEQNDKCLETATNLMIFNGSEAQRKSLLRPDVTCCKQHTETALAFDYRIARAVPPSSKCFWGIGFDQSPT